mgnify:CR=1 FL=1
MPRYVSDRDCPESNLHPCLFTYDGMALPTAEHHFMRAKAKLFDDKRSMRKIEFAVSGSCARKVGRSVQNFDQSVWDARCEAILEDILMEKFTSSFFLIHHISNTEGPFYEASTRSKTWGIGIHVKAAERGEPHVGQNKLGKALDRVQKRIVAMSEAVKRMAGPEGWEKVQDLVDDAYQAAVAEAGPDADTKPLPPEVAAEVVALVCAKGGVTE